MRKVLPFVCFVAVVAMLAAWNRADAQTDTERRLKLLESQVAELRAAVRVEASGVRIVSNGTLKLQAPGAIESQGSIVRLNGGSRPLFVNGPVGAGQPICTVSVGPVGSTVGCIPTGISLTNPSSTVLVP